VPISGGTMVVTRDNTRAIVADPDRDRVVTVQLAEARVLATLQLPRGSEPGRVIEDGVGRIHVALRGSGELLTITGDTHELRPICGEPRGLAWQATGDIVHVACATGELVTMPAGGGEPVRVLRLERDLRDVIVRSTGLAVTTFRTAELLELDAQGAVVARARPAIVHRIEQGGGLIDAVGDVHDAVGEVAWRTIALADGRIAMSHQRRIAAPLTINGYSGGCGDPVESALTIFGTDGVPFAVAPALDGALPVDVALDPVSGALAVATVGQSTVWVVQPTALRMRDDDQCVGPAGAALRSDTPTAVAYRPNGELLVYEPTADVLRQLTGSQYSIQLGGKPGIEGARELFHRQTFAGIACASCHPEARDDGAVWTFDELGPRRTQNLAGSILSRGPYHWGADMESLPALVDDVFTRRMGGSLVTPEEAQALGAWLDRVRPPRGLVRDAAAVVRGEALFDSPEVGCRSCHLGVLFTNNQLANVGLGAVKIPSLLGVGGRAPYMHDGCAATLRDRFGACGGGDQHGHTSQLSTAAIDDLIAYLESL
jgi:hypothetical protein